ncbi:MAG: HIT family protein [Burkholderiaceae bacterium]|nr:HIT family protein [Burkholderiaceae bacterium]
MSAQCLLCNGDGGVVVARTPKLRVVLVDDPDHPVYLRVIWNSHVKEMTDLAEAERARFLAAVFAVETALRETVNPVKINLASLGNQVPHLHWHIVARFADDPHYPNPIWSGRQRGSDPARLAVLRQALPALSAKIEERVAKLS